MSAFRVSVTRPLDLGRFTDRLALVSLFGFGVAGYLLGGWAEGIQSGLAAYLNWGLTREVDPDHPMSANLAALVGGSLALMLDIHAGVLFVMLLVVKVLVGSSGLSPARWEAGVLGVGAIVFAGTQIGWWVGLAMAVALYLDTEESPFAPIAHRWVAGGVAIGASLFYLFLGNPDSWWWGHVAAAGAAGWPLLWRRISLRKRVLLALMVAGLPAAAALVIKIADRGLGDGHPLVYLLLGSGLVVGPALGAIRSDIKSFTDQAHERISAERVSMARWLVTALSFVAWASASQLSVAEAVEPAAPLWAALTLVGLREFVHRLTGENSGRPT